MNENELKHYGVKGMHWGVRRYQNYDGTRIGVSKKEHYNRNKYNTNIPKTIKDAKAQGWQGGVSSNAHQRHTKPGKRNVKYVSPDGHREGVYDYKGKLVGGSYNYSSPITDPVGHLINDITPYVVYGSSKNDPTTARKRVEDLLGLYNAEKDVKHITNAGKDYVGNFLSNHATAVKTGLGYATGHYFRNKLNKKLPESPKDAIDQGWIKLSNKKSALHQFDTVEGTKNLKFISPDGHREVVFTGEKGNRRITKNHGDAGTYNFFNPDTHPIGHAAFDVLPYMFLGNDAQDTVTFFEKIDYSFMNIKGKRIEDVGVDLIQSGKEFLFPRGKR